MRTINKKHLAIVRAASKDETRYVLNGLLLEEVYKERTENGAIIVTKGLKATATDGRILAQFESYADATDDMPEIKELHGADNSAISAIVPTAAIEDIRRSLPKNKRYMTVLENALVKMGKEVTTFASTDMQVSKITPAKNIDGHFPSYNQIMPKAKPVFRFTVGAGYLKELATLAMEVKDKDASLTLEFTSTLNPVKATQVSSDGTFTALLMPRTDGDTRKSSPADEVHNIAAALRKSIKLLKTAPKTDTLKGEIKNLAVQYKRYVDACK